MPRAKRKIDPSKSFERLQKATERFERYLGKKGGKDLWEHQSSTMMAVGLFLHEALEKVSLGQTASGGIVLPTGAGKTVLAAEIAKALGVRALVLAPTKTILLQHHEELVERVPGLAASLYYGDEKDLSGKIIVSTYHSAVSLFKSGSLPEDIGIVFFDEAHRSLSQKRAKLHGKIAPLEIGLTATPAFNSVKHIWTAFDDVICEMDTQEAIELGILSPLRAFVVETNVNLKKVRLRAGREYLNEAEAEKYLNIIARNRSARDFYIERFKGVPAVAFCITKKHAEEFAAYLKASKVKATFIHSDLSNKERTRRLNAFENGDVDVIASRDILIEGWDSKRVILELNLRPTYSRVVKTHMVGRVLRLRPKKEAGIVAEFQDMYDRGQQPILVHHLFDEMTYRQGGFVAAPAREKREEEEKMKKGKKVKILGKLFVSHNVKKVACLDETDVDFRDPKLLREILATRNDIDLLHLPSSKFFSLRFSHPKFHGTGLTLIHKVFGIKHRPHSPLHLKEDYLNFLGYVFEDMPPVGDSRVVFAEDIVGRSFGEGEHLQPPDESKSFLEERIDDVLQTLSPKEEKTIRMLFGIGERHVLTMEEVAEHFEVHPTRIMQIKDKALRKLRHPRRSRELKPFIDDSNYVDVKKLKETIEELSDRPFAMENAMFKLAEIYGWQGDTSHLHYILTNDCFSPEIQKKAGLQLVKSLERSYGSWEKAVPTLFRLSRSTDHHHTVKEAAERALEEMIKREVERVMDRDFSTRWLYHRLFEHLPEDVQSLIAIRYIEELNSRGKHEKISEFSHDASHFFWRDVAAGIRAYVKSLRAEEGQDSD